MNTELHVALEAAHRAAARIRAISERSDIEVRQKSGDRGPLTEADLASNEILVDAITAAFPDDAILSEEMKDDARRLSNARVWILDPLDGTREFTLGVPEFVVSIGLVVHGTPALGVLINPATREVFTGIVGREATYQGSPCHTSNHDRVEGGRFLVSRSEYEKGWFDGWKDRADLRPVGSVAYKLGLVAAGQADATFTPKPRNEWDLAGGVACVLAAGGRTSDGSGTPYRFNRADPLHVGVCGTNGPIHAAVLGLMER